MRWLLLLPLFFVGVLLLAPEAQAQGVTIEGKITFQDGGAPVGGAEVVWSSSTGMRPPRKVKTKEDGTYFIGYAEFGAYKVKVIKKGFLMHTLSITVKTRANKVEFENKGEVGPKQEVPEFRFQPGNRITCDISLVPESFYAGFISGPEADALNAKITEANNLTQSGKYAESDKLLDEVIARLPKAAGPVYLKGVNAAAQADFPGAEANFLKAFGLDPKLPGVCFQLGQVYYNTKQKEKALEWFKKEEERDPEIKEVLINIAITTADLGRSDEALGLWGKIIEKWPTEGAAYGELANLYLSLGKDDKAIEVLNKMEEVAKPDPKLWYNIAANFYNRDQFDQADKAFRKSIELDPSFPDPYRQLGYLFLSGPKEDYTQAQSFLEKYLQLSPQAEDAGAIKQVLEKIKAKKTEKPETAAPSKTKPAPGPKR